MSSTITQTITGQQGTTGSIRLAERSVNPIEVLFRNLSDCPVFSSEERQSVENILKEFTTLRTDAEIVDGLCYILFNITYPSIRSHPQAEAILLELIDEIVSCLDHYLEPGVNVEAFIERKSQEFSMIDGLIELQEEVNRISELFLTTCTRANEGMIRECNEVIRKFTLICKNLKGRHKDIFEKIDAQIKKLEKQIEEVKCELKFAEVLSERFFQENQSLKSIIKRG